jgi:hypothetical protein
MSHLGDQSDLRKNRASIRPEVLQFPTITGRRLSRDAIEPLALHVALAGTRCPSIMTKHITLRTLIPTPPHARQPQIEVVVNSGCSLPGSPRDDQEYR